MAVQPLISLSSLNPDFDGVGPGNTYFEASLQIFGGLSGAISPLSAQFNANEVVLGHDAVGLADETLTSIANDIHGRCAIQMNLYGEGLDTSKHLMLIFQLKSITGPPNAATAQFFVGANLDHSKEIDVYGEPEPVLLEVPDMEVDLYFYARLAGPTQYARMGFAGVDCYYF